MKIVKSRDVITGRNRTGGVGITPIPNKVLF